ncbi:inner centromere protein [Anabrus simplex]|uniref:inner centromere protein n=1 Tax=Anabrus simplex TaxID=316456 RepID=UPI0035A32FC0
MLRKEFDELLERIGNEVESLMPRFDLQEKLDWLHDVVSDAKKNGFKHPVLPKTPSAAKRTRKRRLSPIVEDDIVVLSAAGSRRTTRNAAKVAKTHLSEKSAPDCKSRKKVELQDTISVQIGKENIICTPAVVLLTPLKLKKELTFDDVCINHLGSETSNSPVSSDTFFSSDSGLGARLEAVEPPRVQNLNSTVTLKPSEIHFNSTMCSIAEIASSASPSVKPSSMKELEISAIQSHERNFDKLPRKQSLIDTVTPCEQKLNSTYDVSVKKRSLVNEASCSSEQKFNCTYNLETKEQSIVHVRETPPSQKLKNSFVIVPNVNTTFVVPNDSIPETMKEHESSSHKVSCDEIVNSSCQAFEFEQDTSDKKSTAEEITPESETSPCSEETEDIAMDVVGQHLPPPPLPDTPMNVRQKSEKQDRRADVLSSPRVNKLKPVFSPYSIDSVKERVAAYENLKNIIDGAAADVEGTRMTRTKTRAAAAAAAAIEASAYEEKPLAKKKHQKNGNEVMKKLARKSLSRAVATMTKGAKSKCDGLGKENSLIMSATRGGMLNLLHNSIALSCTKSAQKNNLKTPSSTSRILGEINNFSVPSAKNPAMLRQGIITTSVDTFIHKLPKNPTFEEKEEKKLEERKKREEKEREAALKKEELLRKKAEAQKRKNEEKRKVLEARQAQEREKLEHQRHLLEEKDHRMKLIIQEQEAKQKKEVTKKKMHTQQKTAEVEERRKLEEAIRLAKLKEQEEEQMRIQAARKKEQEEAERQRLKRLVEEKDNILNEKIVQQAKTCAKPKEVPANVKKQLECKTKVGKENLLNYKTPPSKTGNSKAPLKNANDYGIDDVNSDDPSDSEDAPKKTVPKWAQRFYSQRQFAIQAYVPKELDYSFITCSKQSPDISKMFGMQKFKRTSSAVWASPPLRSQVF